MKKIRCTVVLLINIVMVFSLVACGDEKHKSNKLPENIFGELVDDETTKERNTTEKTTMDIETSLEEITTKEPVTTEIETTT